MLNHNQRRLFAVIRWILDSLLMANMTRVRPHIGTACQRTTNVGAPSLGGLTVWSWPASVWLATGVGLGMADVADM